MEINENVQNLVVLIEQAGFSSEIINQLTPDEYENHFPIELKQRIGYGKDVVNYVLNVKWHWEDEQYSVPSIRASLRKELIVPDKVIAGISVAELEARMANVDWKTKDHFDKELIGKRFDRPIERTAQNEALGIISDLQHIRFQNRIEGARLAIQLELKYFADTPNEKYFSLEAAKKNYEITYSFDRETLLRPDALEMYNLLDGRAVKISLPIRHNPDFLRPGYIMLLPAASGEQSLTWIPGPFQEASGLHYLDTQILQEKTDLKNGMNLLDSLNKGNEAEIDIYENGMPARRVLIWFDPTTEEFRSRGAQNAGTHNSDHLNEFVRRVEHMGFEGYGKYIRRNAQNCLDSFDLKKPVEQGSDRFFHSLKVEFSPLLASYEAVFLESILLKGIRLPHEMINEIDVEVLDNRMWRIPWKEKDFWQWGSAYFSPYDTDETLMQLKADRVFSDMDTLLSLEDPKSQWFAGALFMKHLRGTTNEYFMMKFSALRKRYEIKYGFDLKQYPRLNLQRVGNLLQGRSVLNKRDDKVQEWLQLRSTDDQYSLEVKMMPRDFEWDPLWNSLSQSSILKKFPGIWGTEEFKDVMKDRFREGDLVKVDLHLGGKNLSVELQANPATGNLTIIPEWGVTGSVLRSLQSQTGWEIYTGLLYAAAGQDRDYDLHPVPISNPHLESVLKEVELFGFGKSLEGQVKIGVMIGYPSFSIPLNGRDGPLQTEVSLHFKQDNEGHFEFHRFDLYLKDENGLNVSGQTFFTHQGYDDSEYFSYIEACNLLQGRYACHKDHTSNEPLDEWYYLDLSKTMPDGNHEIKACYVDFDLEISLKNFLTDSFPDSDVKDELIFSLRRGDIVQVSGANTWSPQIQYISADPLKGGFRLNEIKSLDKDRNLTWLPKTGGLPLQISGLSLLIKVSQMRKENAPARIKK